MEMPVEIWIHHSSLPTIAGGTPGFATSLRRERHAAPRNEAFGRRGRAAKKKQHLRPVTGIDDGTWVRRASNWVHGSSRPKTQRLARLRVGHRRRIRCPVSRAVSVRVVEPAAARYPCALDRRRCAGALAHRAPSARHAQARSLRTGVELRHRATRRLPLSTLRVSPSAKTRRLRMRQVGCESRSGIGARGAARPRGVALPTQRVDPHRVRAQ